MWRWADVKMSRCERCEDEQMWKMSRCERRCEDEQMWRWADVREDVKMSRCEDEQMWEKMWRWADVKMSRCERRCEDEQMWRWADVREDVKMSRCERRKCEDEKMFRRCEDEKMFYRPPLLEEPCAQTLSGKIWNCPRYFGKLQRARLRNNNDYTNLDAKLRHQNRKVEVDEKIFLSFKPWYKKLQKMNLNTVPKTGPPGGPIFGTAGTA